MICIKLTFTPNVKSPHKYLWCDVPRYKRLNVKKMFNAKTVKLLIKIMAMEHVALTIACITRHFGSTTHIGKHHTNCSINIKKFEVVSGETVL